MPQISTKELLARLESGKPIPALLLLGEEPYLRDECRKQLIEKFVPEAARTWAVSKFSPSFSMASASSRKITC